MAQTRHESLPVVRGYLRDGSLFRRNAAAAVGLLSAIPLLVSQLRPVAFPTVGPCNPLIYQRRSVSNVQLLRLVCDRHARSERASETTISHTVICLPLGGACTEPCFSANYGRRPFDG
jgi:hypothetical protein